MRTAIVIFGLASAGLVGALAAQMFASDAMPTATDPNKLAKLEARVESLEGEVDRLKIELRTLRDAPPLPSPAAIRAEIASELAKESEDAATEAAPTVSEEQLREKVKAAVEERAKEERAAQTRRFSEMAATRDQEQLDRLAKELDLTQYQKDELAKIFDQRRKAMGEFRAKMMSRSAEMTREDRTAIREEARQIRQDSEEEIKSLLSSDQYQSYQKLTSSRGGGGVRGTGGRGTGGGRRR